MASRCSRIINRASISSFKSSFKSSCNSQSPSFNTSFFKSTSPPLRRFSLSRCPSELGAVQSMLPLHSAVATARLTSCLSVTSCIALSQGTLCRTSPSL